MQKALIAKEILNENMSNFVVSNVLADGLALLYPRPSADLMITMG